MSDHNQLPGTGSIADSVEFVKKLWGIPSAGALPGMLIPTLSLDEINKKIADLKAVESWMAVNMNMLRGTIQALEVQSATIINLQSMGAMMGSQQGEVKPAAAGGAAASTFPFSFPGWPPAAQAEIKPEMASPPPPPQPAPIPEPPPVAAAPAEPVAPVQTAAAAPAASAPGANAWWDMLQNQFKQAVNTALMPDALKAVAKPRTAAPKPAASKAKPAARKAPVKAVAKKTPARAKTKTPAGSARKS